MTRRSPSSWQEEDSMGEDSNWDSGRAFASQVGGGGGERIFLIFYGVGERVKEKRITLCGRLLSS